MKLFQSHFRLSSACTAAMLLLAISAQPLAAQNIIDQDIQRLHGFSILGDNPLSDTDTNRVLAPFLRAPANLPTVQKAANAVQAELLRQGFREHVAVLPAQNVRETLLIQVNKLRNTLLAQASPQAASPAVMASAAPAHNPRNTAPVATFPISAFEISGHNPLGAAALQVLAPFVRPDASIESLQKATAALDAELSKQGYGLHRSNLPPQELKDSVRLEIIQFKIGKVNVEGNQSFDPLNVRRALPELQSGQTPDLNLLSRQTALANESAARKLGVSLKASEQADAIDAVVRVKDSKPWWLSASISNSGSKETGRDRFTVAASHTNLWNRDHLLDFAYTTSLQEPSRVRQFGLNYKVPVYPWAGALTFNATSASVKGEFGGFTTNGAGKSWGLGYMQHLGGTGGKRHFVSARIDDKLSEAASVSGFVVGVDRRSRPLTLGYNLRSESDSMFWELGAQYAFNLVSGAGNDDVTYNLEDPNRSPKARWRVARLNGNLVIPMESNWQLTWRNQAQLSQHSLIAAEQIASGGTLWVRGSNGLTADSGYMSALDITSPELHKGFRVLFFLDAGYLSNQVATLAKPTRDVLASGGLGFRYQNSNGLYFTGDYGAVLKGSQIPLTINSLAPQKGDDRFYLTIGYRY